MKKITSMVIATIMLLSYVPFVNAAVAYETLSISVPYTKTKLTAEDFGMTALYTDKDFSLSVEEVTPNFGDKVYASDGDKNYVITPIITYQLADDSQDYYFDFNGSLETDTEKGAYNKLNTENNSETVPVVFTNESFETTGEKTGIYPMYELGTASIDGSKAPTVIYKPEKTVTLDYQNNWKIQYRFLNTIKMGMMFAQKSSTLIGTQDWAIKWFISNGGTRTAISKGNIRYDVMDIYIENIKNSDGSNTIIFKKKKPSDSDWTETVETTFAATDKVAKNIVIDHFFSNGTLWGFKGYVDYIYIITDENYNKAMEYVNKYNTLLSKSFDEINDEDTELITKAVDDYEKFNDDIKNKLVRGEYNKLMELGKALATGDCGISTAFGKNVTIDTGDGTKEKPYIINCDVDYFKSSVSNDDFEISDRWGTLEVTETALDKFVNEISVNVTSADNVAYYKFIVYPIDESFLGDSDAKAFIASNKELFKKTTVAETDKTIIEDAISQYDVLPESALTELSRNEKSVLENLYLQTIFAGIKAADTPEKLLLAVKNTIGVYETDELMAEYIISIRPENGYQEIILFENAYEVAKVVKELKTTTNLSESIVKNTDYLKTDKIDIEEDYKLLSDAEKIKFAELAADINYANGESIGQNLRKAMILAEVKCADSVFSLKNAVSGTDPSGATINNNLEIIGGDINKYNSLKFPEKIYTFMYNDMSLINDFDDIRTYFDKAVQTEYNAETTIVLIPSGSNSGGGGGGSSGGGKVIADIKTDSPVVEEFVNPFTDINDHWGKMYILALAEKKFISGYADSTFKPENNITRAEFVKIVTDAFGITSEKEVDFSDVSESDWFKPYIKKAVSAGLIKGDNNNCVMPDNNITRQDAVVILYRYLQTKIEFKNKTFSFKDNNEISDYAIAAVNDMAYAGIVSGSGSNRFNPLNNMTRAEAAVLISNATDYIQGGI